MIDPEHFVWRKIGSIDIAVVDGWFVTILGSTKTLYTIQLIPPERHGFQKEVAYERDVFHPRPDEHLQDAADRASKVLQASSRAFGSSSISQEDARAELRCSLSDGGLKRVVLPEECVRRRIVEIA